LPQEANIIAQWNFDDDLRDSIGTAHATGRTGAASTTPHDAVFVDGKLGKAIEYDFNRWAEVIGTGTIFDFIDNTKEFSLGGFHVWSGDATNIDMVIAKLINSGSFQGWDLFIDTNGKLEFQQINDVSTPNWVDIVETTASWKKGEGHSWLITKKIGTGANSEYTFYVDGKKVATTDLQTTLSDTSVITANATLGSRSAGAIQAGDGAQDDTVIVWDKELSADEAVKYHESTLSAFTKPK